MKILDRYLSREITFPFVVGLAGFVLIEIGTILFNYLIEVMLEARVPPGLIALALAYKLPRFIVIGLPMATLFGVSLGVNRMAREGEIDAMRMAGIPLRRMLLPLLGIGMAIGIVDFLLNERVTPPFEQKYEQTIQAMFRQSRLPEITDNVFFRAGDYWLYVGTVNRTAQNRFSLRKVMMYELRGARYPVLTVAETGETDGTVWVLRNCRVIDLGDDSEVVIRGDIRVEMDRDIEQFMATQRQPEQLSAGELAGMIQRFRQGNTRVDFLVMAYHLKYSIPVGCIVVVLVSLPLAVHFSRAGSFVGMLLSIVLIFFYYNTYFLLRLLGSGGFLPPVAAAWGHNVIFSLLGLVMLWREE